MVKVFASTSWILAALMLLLLRSWLITRTEPFSLNAGWRPFVAWFLIFAGLQAFYEKIIRDILRTFDPPSPSTQQHDLYILAQAELEAERGLQPKAKASTDDSCSENKVV
jgi:hypothetical protein